MKVLLLLAWCSYILCDEGKEVFEQIQAYRKAHSLPGLARSQSLTNTARDRVENLLGSKNLLNNNPDIWTVAEKNQFHPVSIGENIGKSANLEKKGRDIFNEWINSPVHKENLIDPRDYTHLGVYKITSESHVFVSAVFARKDPGHPESRQPSHQPTTTTPTPTPTPSSTPSPIDSLSVTSTTRQTAPSGSNNLPNPTTNPTTTPSSTPSSTYGPMTPQTPSPNQNPNPNLTTYSPNPNPSPSQNPTPTTSRPNPTHSPSPSPTFLITIPESMQKNNSVIKLVIVKDTDGRKDGFI
ncbi:hypothetical protein NEDG_01390 [Nematocida displodere]|uniref:SCP domain-containing protein n=1 Tax=Nematocida displodere TaxID=1805483 RepID=A0A177EBJ9_9MICR|nr:hypothetical protein NEDG_01390 [Nematocida displodere]